MDTRARFLAVMNFEPVDRTLLWEDGYWLGAVRHQAGVRSVEPSTASALCISTFRLHFLRSSVPIGAKDCFTGPTNHRNLYT